MEIGVGLAADNKSDIWYVCIYKTSRPLNILIHSRALLVAICSQLTALQAPQLATHFWHFCSQSASRCCVYIGSTPQYLKIVTLLDYSL